MSSASVQTPRNQILAKLSPKELSSLLSCMELEVMDIRDPLYEADTPIERAYFPESGVMSIVTLTEDGPSVEAVTVGWEGMIGLPLILGAKTTPTRAFCQVPGRAYSIAAADLLRHVERSADLSLSLRRYAQTVFDLMAQSTACNRLHTIEERCARWLLMTQDRMESDSFQLTQEFLATMLGVHRPGVSLVAKTLQKAGLIDYKHGTVTVIDRPALEQVSCACYRVVRTAFDKLINAAM